MTLADGMIGGLVGGLAGIIAWVIVGLLLDRGCILMIPVVGALVGLGVKNGISAPGGVIAGGAAASIALVCIAVGRYVSIAVVSRRAVARLRARGDFHVDHAVAQLSMAREMAREARIAGRELNWPAHSGPNLPISGPEDLPPEIWSEVQARWKTMGLARQKEKISAVQEIKNRHAREIVTVLTREALVETFKPLGLILVLTALGTAFWLGMIGSPTSPA